ncbi:601_t:CDS:2 [Rhizophagus irregularis]|nr:601_t:CDS:2 [Rhizophagus irregularis]
MSTNSNTSSTSNNNNPSSSSQTQPNNNVYSGVNSQGNSWTHRGDSVAPGGNSYYERE